MSQMMSARVADVKHAGRVLSKGFLGALFAEMTSKLRKLPFFENAILETAKIRIFVNMASKLRKLQFFVNAILETVSYDKNIRKYSIYLFVTYDNGIGPVTVSM